MRLIPRSNPIPAGFEHERFRLPFETIRWPGREISWEDWDKLPDA